MRLSRRRRALRSWLITYAIALGVAIIVVGGALVGVNRAVDDKIDAIDKIPIDVAEDTSPAEPANYLLIGNDSREFVDTPEEIEAFGDPTVETGRLSDTIMVIHVEPEQRTGVLISFPRDLLVEIPGRGESKINAAYAEGGAAGAQKVIDTLKANFNIDIQHFLEVDIPSFEGIVDAVGGVPIYFERPARDEYSNFGAAHYGVAGCYTLDGATALAYSRSRHYEEFIEGEWVPDEKNDFGRIERQQKLMRRIATEAVRRSLQNPLAANTIANEALAELTTDDQLGRDDINKLIEAFREIDPYDEESLQMLTLPTERDPSYGSLGDVQLLIEDQAAPMLDLLRGVLAAAPPPADTPVPDAINVQVLNGSGAEGAAESASTALEDMGFVTREFGTNPATVDTTEIRYRPGAEAAAASVQASLGGAGELIEDPSVVDLDVLVVLGVDFEGVSGTTAATPSTEIPTTDPPVAGGTDEEPIADPC